MLIIDVINRMKKYHRGVYRGQPIDEKTTRDQILYGNANKECTGVVTTIYASPDVIRKAAELGANLIICHEALFWNHGDHTDWLADSKNKAYLEKKKLLDETGIVVWRDHDHIHSGIPCKKGGWTDGIFYGVAKELGWENYIVQDQERPVHFEIPDTTLAAVSSLMMEKFGLDGIRYLGDPEMKIRKVWIVGHLRETDPHMNDMITEVDRDDIDLVLPLETIDFTLLEYVRDSAILLKNKALISMGHFNIEEPGMKYMVEYFHEAVGTDKIPCTFISTGDMYHYSMRK